MKYIPFAVLLFAAPAFAQTLPAPAGQRAWELMSQQCMMREQNATGVAIEQADKVTSLTKQLADMTKERDALKAAAAKTATVKPDAP